MNCTHCPNCLHVAPLSGLLPDFRKPLWDGVARLWRFALASLAQLG